MEECLSPFYRQLDVPRTIPGVSQHVAEVIVSEIKLAKSGSEPQI